MEKEKELNRAIVKGEVAIYAKNSASINNVSKEELAVLLREIADLLS